MNESCDFFFLGYARLWWETVVVPPCCSENIFHASIRGLEPVFSVLVNAAGLCRHCLSSREYQGLYARQDSFSEKTIPEQPRSKDNRQHMEIHVQASPPH